MGFQKDLFGLEELSPEEIRYLLRAADSMKYVLRQKKQKAHYIGMNMTLKTKQVPKAAIIPIGK